MIDDFLDYLSDYGFMTDEDVNLYGLNRICKEFLFSYPEYDNEEFRNFIKNEFAPRMKMNICELKLEKINEDFR